MFKVVICFIIAICFVVSASAEEQVATNIKLKIGIAAPLSGNSAWMGEELKHGIDLYLKANPSAKDRLELFFEDTTTSNTATAVSAVNYLINNKSVDSLILLFSPVAFAAGPIIEKAGIPTIAITGADTAKDRQYMIKLWMSPKAEAKVNVSEISKHLEWTSLGFVTAEQESMLARTKETKELLAQDPGLKIDIIFDETVVDNENLDLIAIKTAQRNPKCLIVNLMPGQAGLFVKKLREKRYIGQILGSPAMSEKSENILAQGALSGALYVDSYYSDEFIKSYNQDYARYPLPGSANGFDAIKLFDLAFQKTGKVDKEDINKNIRVKNFSGALGSYSFIEDSFNTYDLKAVMRVVE